jgi:hypothetical protein
LKEDFRALLQQVTKISHLLNAEQLVEYAPGFKDVIDVMFAEVGTDVE